MKKNVPIPKNLWKIMKITIYQFVLAIICGSMSFAHRTSAQEVLNRTISVVGEKIELREILNQIEKKADVKFVYSTKIKSGQRLTLNLTNMKLANVLEEVLKPASVEYEVIENRILLKNVKNQPSFQPNLMLMETLLEQSVKGFVKDENGVALPGVSVILKGTQRGMTTDGQGAYQLSVPNSESILVFSYVGYLSQEVKVGSLSTINITLRPNNQSLEEVVVVGYGTQKKANLTGSVASVSANELVKRPATNVENLLQGKVSGLQVVQSSGEPGNDNAVLRIRGLGTFSGAGSAPLVLVNGVQGTLTGLNPSDIESITVLKDAASASIYGARAANGVILVTTKQGAAGVLNIDYSMNYQLQQPTKMPEFVTNSADFMQYWNTANKRANDINYFSQAEIDAFRNATDRVKYPNFNWVEHMIGNGQAQNHHLSMNGGNDKTKFNMSLGYLNQDGVNKAFNYKRYTGLLNINSKLNKVVTIGANVTLNNQERAEPVMGSKEFMLLVYTSGPNYMPKLSDGSGRWTWRYNNAAWHNRNPEAALSYGNIQHYIYSFAPQAYIDVNLAKGLVFSMKGAINYDAYFDKQNEHNVKSYFYSDNTLAANSTSYNVGVTDYDATNILTTFYSTLNYSKTIAKNHELKGLVGYSQEANKFRYIQGHKTVFPSDNLSELNAGSPTGQWLNGSSNEWALQSLFGRVNYDFKGRYLLEVNVRYDGSSRIQQDQRWGVFPSASVGWRVNDEPFMKNVSWLDDLKVRGSFGKLGNQNIGLYPYQDILSLNTYAFGSSVDQGVSATRLVDKTLKWETTTITDIGLDLSLKRGMFTMTADWFNKVTDDILYGIDIPASIGLSSPTVNYAKMKNTGFEFELGYKNSINDFKYGVNFNLTSFKNEVLKVKAPTYGQTTIQEGLPWNSYYLTEWIGIFQSQEEIDKSPKQPYNPKPGDLKFKDQNGDGVIDSKDRVVVDGAFPKFYYGGSVNLSWKNFDLSSFFQGVEGQKFYVNAWGIDPFIQGSAPTVEFANNAWTPENKSNTTPAMYRSGYGPVTGTPSTYYLKDASYLRLKNLVIGYTLPTAMMKKIGIKTMRIYVSGDNLLTITKYPAADPERTGSGQFQTYPQLRVFTTGINVKF